MRNHRDAKLMASTLRQALQEKNVELSHSESLEIVARQFGVKNWNILAAALEMGRPPCAASLATPVGWFKSGQNKQYYDVGVDPDVMHDGIATAVIRSRSTDGELAHPDGAFATLMQTVSATQWLGRRIAVEARLRTLDVEGAGAVWCRVDSPTGKTLAFDNMEKRQTDGILTGTKTWTKRRVVLDVGPEAATVNYGFMLRGTGRVWAASFNIQEVGPDIASTDTHSSKAVVTPTNLDFSLLESTGD